MSSSIWHHPWHKSNFRFREFHYCNRHRTLRLLKCQICHMHPQNALDIHFLITTRIRPRLWKGPHRIITKRHPILGSKFIMRNFFKPKSFEQLQRDVFWKKQIMCNKGTFSIFKNSPSILKKMPEPHGKYVRTFSRFTLRKHPFSN